MNDKLAKRIADINKAEFEQGDRFQRWITRESDTVIGRDDRRRLNNEICDYVRGLLMQIGDLEEQLARVNTDE